MSGVLESPEKVLEFYFVTTVGTLQNSYKFIIIVMRSIQPKPPVVEIIHQNGPFVSRQIW